MNWNKYESKVTTENRNQYLDYLNDPIFLGVNRIFVSSFEEDAHRKRHIGCFLPKVDIKDCERWTKLF